MNSSRLNAKNTCMANSSPAMYCNNFGNLEKVCYEAISSDKLFHVLATFGFEQANLLMGFLYYW